MTGHLADDRLVPDPQPALTAAEHDHLGRCARCRVEARLMADAFAEADATDAEDDRFVRALDAVRTSWRGATGATLAPEAFGTVGPAEVLPTADPHRFGPPTLLGRGGMGDVHRVRDTLLRRTVARKVAHPHLRDSATGRDRFLAEARVGAQLQHPGIVPVHDLGQLEDGRPFFTMKEVDGTTLREVVRELHRASSLTTWGTPHSGLGLRRVLDAFRRVCETIAYAHSRGVVHRDLKPDNLMLGAFGEVLVLDWGLAKVIADAAGEDDAVDAGRQDALSTRAGAVAGTPAYMPPEQAAAAPAAASPAADVYALGAVLWEILVGHAPYPGHDGDAVLQAVLAGPPPRPSDARRGPPIPQELEAICLSAMARDPEARSPGAGVVAEAVTAWLDGAHRRDQALAALDTVRPLLPAAEDAMARARALRDAARKALAALQPFDPDTRKRPAWDQLEQAERLETEARVLRTRFTEGVHAALTHDPGLPEAHALLADHYRDLHAAAEARHDLLAAASLEVQLRAHDQGAHRRYLAGLGTLTLVTEPPGAVVTVHRYVQEGRRLLPRPTGQVLRTPLHQAPLPCGSYLLELSVPGRAPVRLPVRIRRDHDEVMVRPGSETPWTQVLTHAVSEGEILVPAGWFDAGGDPLTASSLPGRPIWVDDVVITRDPITIGDYLVFLDDLVQRGEEARALRHAIRERPAHEGAEGELLLDHTPGTGFSLRPDAEGDLWDTRWPAWMVSWHDARAYAAWRAERDGLPWRLPWELEWEKAARGVDGRPWPWGHHADPTWAAVEGSRAGRPSPVTVDAMPVDTSPYGVRGMAGNVCDWTLDVYREAGPSVGDDGLWTRPDGPEAPDGRAPRTVRGGMWSRPVDWGRTAFRVPWEVRDRRWAIGFRLARTP